MCCVPGRMVLSWALSSSDQLFWKLLILVTLLLCRQFRAVSFLISGASAGGVCCTSCITVFSLWVHMLTHRFSLRSTENSTWKFKLILEHLQLTQSRDKLSWGGNAHVLQGVKECIALLEERQGYVSLRIIVWSGLKGKAEQASSVCPSTD